MGSFDGTGYHVLTMTTPDDPAYENKPSDWNAEHIVVGPIYGDNISDNFTHSTNDNVSFGRLGAGPGGLIQAFASVGFSAGTLSSSITHVNFVNSNGISFGFSTSSLAAPPRYSGIITASHDGLTSQSNQVWNIEGVGSSDFQTLNFNQGPFNIDQYGWVLFQTTSTGAGISSIVADYLFYVSAGTLFTQVHQLEFVDGNGITFGGFDLFPGVMQVGASYTNSSWTVSDAATSGTVGRLAFTNLNGVTLSLSSGTGGRHTIVGSHNALTSQSNQAASASNGSFAFQTINFSNANNVTFGTSAGSIVSASVAAQSVQPVAASASNGSFNFSTLAFSNANNVTFGTSAGSIITASVAAGGGAAATQTNFFEPWYFADAVTASATTTASASQLFVQPFSLPVNLSFGQLNLIGSHAFATSAGNTFTARMTPATAMRYVAGYSITNSCLFDFFMMSKGTGGYSSELETVSSTRESVIHGFRHTFDVSMSHNNVTNSTGSFSVRRTVEVSLTYPMMTSGTTTSVNPASTFTVWGTGTSSWSGSASNSTSQTYNTTTTASTSMASTHPAITEWSSNKMWPFRFGGSMSAGEWYLGINRNFSTSSSSSSANTNATATGNSYTAAYNASAMTESGSFTWAGRTNSLASSLGWPGQNTANSMAPEPGHGSFSGTWNNATTYLNNAVNPAGAVAYTQLRTHVSFFNTWFQLGSNRI